MKYIFPFIISAGVILSGCSTLELQEPYRSDFRTSGPLGEDCFQVVVQMPPDKSAVTMHERRESAFLKARKSIYSEAEKQISEYIISSLYNTSAVKADEASLKKKSATFASGGKVEHEFYLNDDSVVLIYRIYKKGIKNQLLEK